MPISTEKNRGWSVATTYVLVIATLAVGYFESRYRLLHNKRIASEQTLGQATSKARQFCANYASSLRSPFGAVPKAAEMPLVFLICLPTAHPRVDLANWPEPWRLEMTAHELDVALLQGEIPYQKHD